MSRGCILSGLQTQKELAGGSHTLVLGEVVGAEVAWEQTSLVFFQSGIS